MNKIFILVGAALLAASAVPAQDWARARIDKSPRHGEWAAVQHDSRKIESFITYPEVKDKATAVVVIHEIYGLTDWARSVTDEFAEAGYIAIAPDLLSGLGTNGGGTMDMPSANVGRAIQSLPADQITADLNAVVDYVSKLPSCNGKVVVIGFCWGGGQSFSFAANNKNLKAAFVCYGTGPATDAEVARIDCPVYGFYGGNDARVTSTVKKTAEMMKQTLNIFEPTIYEGAGHGFMRAGETPLAPDADERAKTAFEANKKACAAAWQRIKGLLAKIDVDDNNIIVRDASVIARKAAVENLMDQGEVAKAAIEEKDECVRLAAVYKLTNQVLLAKIAVQDQNEYVRLAAGKMRTEQGQLEQMQAQLAAEKLRLAKITASLPKDRDKNAIYWLVETAPGRFRLKQTIFCQPGGTSILAETPVPCGSVFVNQENQIGGSYYIIP